MPERRVRFSRLLVAAATATLVVAAPEVLSAQVVGVKVLPSAARISWDDALALEDDWLYGGRLALTFGSQIELQPFFLRGTGIGVDSARARRIGGATTFARAFDIDHYGATAQVNLGRGDLVPFVRVGGGILKFESDSTPDRRRVSVLAGGGLRLQLGGLSGELFAEHFQFRMAPSRLFSVDTASVTGDDRSPVQRNTAYGASIAIPLSAFPETAPGEALRGTRAPLEPFVGRLRYDGDLDLRDQDLVGLRAGIDLNSLVGVRGFFWRGINRDHNATDDVSGYGGEAQFNLNSGWGITPYLVTGAGRIDYDRDFRDAQDRPRQDQTALILGGGASLTLSDRVRINVSIRDYITTADDALEATRDPDDLLHNRLLSAGLTWSIGGQSSDAARREDRDRRMTRRDRELERLRMENDSLMELRRSGRLRDDRTERRRMRERMEDPMVIRRPGMRELTPSDTNTRLIVIPAPTVGEVIIRYGGFGPPSITRDTMPSRRSERDPALRDSMATMRDAMVDSAGIAGQLSAMERRLTEHLDRRIDALDRSPDSVDRRREAEVVSPPREPDAPRGASFLQRLGQLDPSSMSVMAGYGSGDGSQLVIDARADLGPLNPGSRFRLVPELALGVGGDHTTLLGTANLRYDVLTLGGLQPYVMGGAGFFSRTLLGVVTSVGASTDLRGGRSGSPLYGFVELQGINLFDRTRLLLGVSSRR